MMMSEQPEETRERRPGWYAWVAVLASNLTMGALAVLISVTLAGRAVNVAEAQRHASDEKWCALLVTLDESYNDPAHAPSTELGRNIAKAIHDLRNGYNCPPPK